MRALGYMTEDEIKNEVRQTYLLSCAEKKQKPDMRLLEGEQYQAWTRDRVEVYRSRKLLVTAQQKRDILTRNPPLQVGDTVRYVGPNIINGPTSLGSYVPQNTGTLGTVTYASVNARGQLVFKFMPHIPKQAIESQTGGEYVELTTGEVHEYERVP